MGGADTILAGKGHLAMVDGSRKLRAWFWLVVGTILVLVYLLHGFFILEAFKIPAESMVPTLMVGDHIFVTKLAYGLNNPFANRIGVRFSDPAYGDVVIFVKPSVEEQTGAPPPVPMPEFFEEYEMIGKEFIKRVVALGGDTVEMRDDVLYVNGQALPRCRIGDGTYKSLNRANGEWEDRSAELHLESNRGVVYTIIEEEDGPISNFEPSLVPDGQAFVLGDNRDNSNDSRYWGSVPYDNIIGRANIIWWSDRPSDGIHTERMGHHVMSAPDLIDEQRAALKRCPEMASVLE